MLILQAALIKGVGANMQIMVVGNGMIAKAFYGYQADDRFVIFASGVSNSATASVHEYLREKTLLENTLATNKEKTLVYISTCSIYDASLQTSPYVLHKKEMERQIISSGSHYLIFRVSNPVGNTNNRHTFLNYFVQHLVKGIHFDLWKYAGRNLIDLDDMYAIANYLLQEGSCKNSVINIANPTNYPVIEIAEAIKNHYNISGNYTVVEKGNSPLIDTSEIQPLLDRLGINFNSNYLQSLLLKYFPLA